MFLEILLDNSAELGDQLKQTDFEKTIKESIIAFKEGNDNIFSKKVIECFLFDGTLSYLFWSKLVLDMMCYFIRFAVELELYVELVFEKIMRSVHIEGQQT